MVRGPGTGGEGRGKQLLCWQHSCSPTQRATSLKKNALRLEFSPPYIAQAKGSIMFCIRIACAQTSHKSSSEETKKLSQKGKKAAFIWRKEMDGSIHLTLVHMGSLTASPRPN